MVKTASTWVRSLCSHPSGGFSPINFVSFHVTLKALLPPGVKALPSSCASGTSFNCIKKKGDVYQKEKKERSGQTTTLNWGIYVLHSWRGGAGVLLLIALIFWFFSKQTPFFFFLKATVQRKCSNVHIEIPLGILHFSLSHLFCSALIPGWSTKEVQSRYYASSRRARILE